MTEHDLRMAFLDSGEIDGQHKATFEDGLYKFWDGDLLLESSSNLWIIAAVARDYLREVENDRESVGARS